MAPAARFGGSALARPLGGSERGKRVKGLGVYWGLGVLGFRGIRFRGLGRIGFIGV